MWNPADAAIASGLRVRSLRRKICRVAQGSYTHNRSRTAKGGDVFHFLKGSGTKQANWCEPHSGSFSNMLLA